MRLVDDRLLAAVALLLVALCIGCAGWLDNDDNNFPWEETR